LHQKQTYRNAGLADRGLIIFPGALGDLICLLPSIRALAARHLDAAFDLMARAELARFAVGRMGMVASHSIDRQEVAHLFAEDGAQKAAPLFSQFARIECFFAGDNQQFRRSLILVARGRISFYPFRPPGDGHMAEAYLRLLGEPLVQPLRSVIDLTPEDLSRAHKRLQHLGLEPGRFVLFLPGSGSIRKNWPADNFAALANTVRPLLTPLVVLGPAETALDSSFAQADLLVLRDLELGELAGIARLSRAFVGNDSGLSHLAAAVGAHGLVLFGPTEPERWRPLGDVRIIRREPLQNLSIPEISRELAELLDSQTARV
jgi:heptosyltransferase-2